MWNKIKNSAWFIPLIVALAVAVIAGGVFAAVSAWQSANLKGTGTITVTTNPPPPPTQLSFTTGLNSDGNTLSGSLSSGFTIVNSGIAGTSHTLTLASPSANTAVNTASFSFTLTASPSEKTALIAYFNAKAGWTSAMQTQIDSEINGTTPFFYLKYDGTNFSLVDAFKQFLGVSYAPYPLTVDDDYPVGTYAYTGTINAVDGTSQTVTVTLIVTEPTVWKIGTSIVTGSSSITLTFAPTSVATGGAVSTTATLNLTDVGQTAITGWALGTVSGYPTGLTAPNLVVTQTPVGANGGTATLTFTLTGTAPSSAGSLDLSNITCTLTPIGN